MPAHIDDLVRSVHQNRPHALVAVDFDGTLAPIVNNPADSRPIDGSVEALAQLAEQGVQIAVVTGRDAHNVVELGDLSRIPRLVVEGLYGAEEWQQGRLTTLETPEPIRALRAQLPRVLADNQADPKVWIEDKRLSLVVHSRLAADPDAALAVLEEPITELGRKLRLEIHPGRYVLELRLPGFNKANAVHRLIERAKPAVIVYAGDDLGDVPAFDYLANVPNAWRVAVSSSEVPNLSGHADLTVNGPEGVLDLLQKLANEPANA